MTIWVKRGLNTRLRGKIWFGKLGQYKMKMNQASRLVY